MLKIQRFELRLRFPVSHITFYRKQPKGRRYRARKGLSASVEEHGILDPITCVPLRGHKGRLEAADGWGRLELAKKYGIPFVPVCIYYGPNAEELAIEMGTTESPWNTKELAQAVAKTPGILGSIRKEHERNRIDSAISLFGLPFFDRYVHNGAGVHHFLEARHIAEHCGIQGKSRLRRILKWVVRHKMTKRARFYIRHLRIPPNDLARYIRNNKPLPEVVRTEKVRI